MMPITRLRLPGSRQTTIIQPRVKHVTILALCLLTHGALAQQQSDSKSAPGQGQGDLDVTMQIIVDPDAKLPDEVVRRIPLPERKSAESAAAANADKKAAKAAATESKQAAREAKELAKEASQAAKEEAAEQREAARRARAEERERKKEDRPPRGNPNAPGQQPR
ncbi:hypothetical protein [Peristeroidobacter soli]|jgi:hypothetical protein|uniref:hypothetical protein n=1 Tax=Peristeroidobacter soli TaxID=2497877 RepID=UPI00158B000A|nr:hypothetical protein [Peristeroidobacter soli]